MKQNWLMINDKFNQLSMRERVLIITSFIGGGVYLIYSLVLEPNYMREQRLVSQLSSLQQQVQQYDFDKIELQRVLAMDPNEVIKLRIARIENELQLSNHQLTNLTADLINSNQMALVLGDVLSRAKNVKLIEIESLPVTTFSTNTGQGKSKKSSVKAEISANQKVSTNTAISTRLNALVSDIDSDVLLYRHGLRITMTGSFFDIQAYLAAIEQLPKKFYWQMFDYQLQQYPAAEVVMEIYTLSINKEFIRG